MAHIPGELMPIDASNIYSVKDSPAGYVWAVTGAVLEPRTTMVSMPIYSKRINITKNNKIICENAFCVTTVDHPTRFLCANARQPLGDVTFEGDNVSFDLQAEESSMLMTKAEAEAGLAAIAASPIGVIEEELTAATYVAISARLEEASKSSSVANA